MNPQTIAFDALDDARLTFMLPRRANKSLILRALRLVHEGKALEGACSLLTRTEREFVLDVIAELEAHRPKPKPVALDDGGTT